VSESDRVLELASSYVDGTLSEEETRQLEDLLRSDEAARARFEELLDIQGLITAALASPDVKDAVIERILREQTARRKKKVLWAIGKPGPARPARRRRVAPLYWSAIAASVLIAVGLLWHGTRPEPDALDRLIAMAADAHTTQDLRSLHEDTMAVYRAEYARGDDCRLRKLFNLGLSCAVTGIPKEDRQTEDLRFLLRQAKLSLDRASVKTAAFRLPRLCTVAEAAVTRLGRADHSYVRETYEKARTAVATGDFDLYEQLYLDAHNALGRLKQHELAHLLTFESMYIQYYLRGLPGSEAALENVQKTWLTHWPYRIHFDKHLAPRMKRRIALCRELAADIDFSPALQHRAGGRWLVGSQGGAADGKMIPGWTIVKQTDPDTDNARILLGKQFFEEAILTGQCMFGEGEPGFSNLPNMRLLIHGGPGRNATTWGAGINNADGDGTPLPKRWTWFLVHFNHEGSGRWRQSLWSWYEGEQPHGFREVVDPSLIPTSLMAYSTATEKPIPPPAGIGLGTRRAAVTWRALGLRVLRPAPGAKKKGTWVDGPVIYQEYFEKGTDDWKACLYAGKEPESRDWRSCKDVPYVRLGKGPGARGGAQSLILDAKGLGEKSACVNLHRPWPRGPFSIEWDLTILEGYEGRGTTFDLFLDQETVDSREDIELNDLGLCKLKRWVRQRRVHIPGVTPAGTPYVDVLTYRDGKLQRHERYHRDMMDIYFTARFSIIRGRCAIDNLVIRKMVLKDE